MVWLAVQAERGLPLLRPDAPLAAAGLAGVLLAAAVATLLVVRDRRA
ncbi:hypothetical protein [uncultured Friedmanniella sp.]